MGTAEKGTKQLTTKWPFWCMIKADLSPTLLSFAYDLFTGVW